MAAHVTYTAERY